MKAFMIYWKNGTVSITFARNKNEAKHFFDVIGDVDDCKIATIDPRGIVIDYDINAVSNTDTQLSVDKALSDALYEIYENSNELKAEEDAISSIHQENHSTTP